MTERGNERKREGGEGGGGRGERGRRGVGVWRKCAWVFVQTCGDMGSAASNSAFSMRTLWKKMPTESCIYAFGYIYVYV